MYGQYIVPDAKELMSLGVGQPSPYILDTAKQFISYSIEDHNVLQYGMKNGFEDYRKMVCELMKTFIIDNSFIPEPDNIYMTNGITQAIFMLGSLLKKHRYKTVYVEDLTYFIIINIFKDLDFEIKSFNIDNIGELRKNLDKEEEASLIYLIPFCNNPTGRTLSYQGQTNEIIRIAQDYNVLILSDETYQFLHYSNYHSKLNSINCKPLATYSNNIISLGTFSKILVPGIRLGWIYSQKDVLIGGWILRNFSQWLDNTGFMDSGGSVNPTMAYMVTNNLKSKFNQYKEFLFGIVHDLEKKSNLIINVLNKYPDYFEPIIPDGGYFVFVKSLKMESEKLLELAKKCGLSFHCGNKFTILDNQTHTFRLSVSYYSLTDFETYFEARINKLVDEINQIINLNKPKKKLIGLYGCGKLGKIIVDELIKNKYDVYVIDRYFINFHLKHNEIETIIDVSSPDGTQNLLSKLLDKNFNHINYHPRLVIGTTGHNEEQIKMIENYSKLSPVVYCSNFSQGIQQILSIISNLNFKVEEVEITDIHHIEKKDAPSGTAKLLKKHLEKKYPNIEVKIISERVGDVAGVHIIKLIGNDETIGLNHYVWDRKIFATGCIGLIDKIANVNVGLYEWLN